MATDTSQPSVGRTVTAVVSLSTANNKTDGATAVLAYDPRYLTYVSTENGTLYNDYVKPKIDTKTNTVTITAITDANTYFTGQGVFAKITFRAKAKGQTSIDFVKADNASKSSIAAQGKDVLGEATRAVVTIQ